jgi:hypothetical protein
MVHRVDLEIFRPPPRRETRTAVGLDLAAFRARLTDRDLSAGLVLRVWGLERHPPTVTARSNFMLCFAPNITCRGVMVSYRAARDHQRMSLSEDLNHANASEVILFARRNGTSRGVSTAQARPRS